MFLNPVWGNDVTYFPPLLSLTHTRNKFQSSVLRTHFFAVLQTDQRQRSNDCEGHGHKECFLKGIQGSKNRFNDDVLVKVIFSCSESDVCFP